MRNTGSRTFIGVSLAVVALVVGVLALRNNVFRPRIADTTPREEPASLGSARTAPQSGAFIPQGPPLLPGETPEAIIKRWPQNSRRTAALLLEKYGAPHQFDRDTMAWFNAGDWKKTVVRGSAAAKNRNFLEQTVGYLVPSDKVAELERFDPRVDVSLTAGELSFASDSEATNRLAVNLAEEIVTGKRNVADARAFYQRTARLAASGKSSSYLDSIQFDVDNSRYMTPTGADR